MRGPFNIALAAIVVFATIPVPVPFDNSSAAFACPSRYPVFLAISNALFRLFIFIDVLRLVKYIAFAR